MKFEIGKAYKATERGIFGTVEFIVLNIKGPYVDVYCIKNEHGLKWKNLSFEYFKLDSVWAKACTFYEVSAPANMDTIKLLYGATLL